MVNGEQWAPQKQTPEKHQSFVFLNHNHYYYRLERYFIRFNDGNLWSCRTWNMTMLHILRFGDLYAQMFEHFRGSRNLIWTQNVNDKFYPFDSLVFGLWSPVPLVSYFWSHKLLYLFHCYIGFPSPVIISVIYWMQ